jgi:crotonobetainyl-CoA:carnitine CoA-transferase CaiB-like acyl-CoA transferase
MNAYQAILEALIGRAATGRGRHIEVSMFQAMADWMNVPYLQYRYGGKAPTRQGLRHPTIAPYGVFTCKDGKDILISVQNDREWRALCDAFGCPEQGSTTETATGEARVTHRDLTDDLVQRHLAQLTRDEAIALFDRARIAFGRVSTMEDIAALPKEHFMKVDTVGGTLDLLAPGVRVDGSGPSHGGAVPDLDQHGTAIREEFSR